jgi:peptidyl-prolyl cis-trans isomerase C
MRISPLALAFGAALLAVPALAQTPPPPADPVVAKVNGQEIRLSDIAAVERTLPDQMRGMPAAQLYPMLLDQLVDQRALVLLARKRGLDKDPVVALAMQRAADQALQNALISKDVGPLVADPALQARYTKDIAGKPGEEEVHARHILVATEAEAKQVVEQLKKGGDFAAIAKARSTDPGAAQGGDLGFFKKGEMVPEFAEAAFALKPGQVSDKPVKTQYGWHVIRVEERRTTPAPTFEQARDELRQQAIQEGIAGELKVAREGLVVERFNADGSPLRPTDNIVPPPVAKP